MNHRAERTALWLFGLVAVLPIGLALAYGALYSVGLVGLLSKGFTVEHLTIALGGAELWQSLGISTVIAGTCVLATVALALPASLLLRPALQRGPLSTLIYLPLALPATVAAFFVFQVFSDAGLLARVAHTLSLIQSPSDFPALIHDPWGAGIIAAHLLLAVPYFTLLFRQIHAGEKVDQLTTLAASMGASSWTSLRLVTVPVLLRGAATNLVLLFIAVMGSYEIPLLLGSQSPQMLSVLTMRKYAMYDLAQKPQAFIAALLYAAVVYLLLTLVFRRGENRFGCS